MRLRSPREIFELSLYPICLTIGLAWGLPIWGTTDFGSFYASGLAASVGDNPYGVYLQTFYVESVWFTGFNQNLNPPTALPLFEALSSLPLDTAFLVWWLISLVCAALLMRLLLREYEDRMTRTAILWFLSMGALWDTLHLGQIYLPLALASAIAWTRLRNEKGMILAGILIGFVAAIKPNFLVWPVLLLLSGHLRVSLAGFITAALLFLGSVAIYGPGTYLQWFELLSGDGARAIFPTNGSLVGIFARAGIPEVGWIMSVALLAATGLWALIARPNVLKASACALVVSLLASPIAWGHYALFLAPVLIGVWHCRGALGVAASVALALPFIVIIWTPPDQLFARLTIGSIHFWAFLAIFILVMRSDEFRSLPDRQIADAGSGSQSAGALNDG